MQYSSQFRRFVIGLTLFWLFNLIFIPHLMILVTSLLSPDTEHFVVWPLNLMSYHKIFQPIYLQIFWQSLRLALITTVFCFLIAYPFSAITARLSFYKKLLLLFFLIVPFWTNSLIRTYAIKMLLSTKGIINSILLYLHIIDQPLHLLYSDFAVIFGLVYILLPFMILPLLSSFEQLDNDVIEASKDLGANIVYRFVYIIFPLTLPGIVAGVLLVFLPALGMFYIPDVLGGSTILLVGNLIRNQFLIVQDWPFGASLSIFFIMTMLAMLFFYYKINRIMQKRGGLDDENI